MKQRKNAHSGRVEEDAATLVFDLSPTITMPEKTVNTPYPLLDADPHFLRVVRYFRPSDYAWIAGSTVVGPSLLMLYGMIALRFKYSRLAFL